MGTTTSTANKIPDHWKLNEQCSSISSAVERLREEGQPYRMYTVKDKENAVIQSLVRFTWQKDKVGMGRDARNLTHTCLQIDKVERIENPQLLEHYNTTKARLMRNPVPCQPLKTAEGSTGPVMTKQFLQAIQNNIIGQNISSKINECYLFHGTKEDTVDIICRDGLDNRFSSDHALLGRGLYTAESSTKADQYTDNKTDRNDNTKKMFMVRVLLGDSYINTDQNPPKFQRPPCKSCKQILCNCGSTSYYDSVVDDAARLFREFVVYDKGQCYPDYLITYRRVQESDDSGSQDQPYPLQLRPDNLQNVVADGQIVVRVSDSDESSSTPWWSEASVTNRILLVLACMVLCVTFLNAALMTAFGLYFIGECKGSPYVPASTLIIGLMTYTVYITLPYMLLDWCGDKTALIMKKSFRIILAVALVIQAAIQISNWAVVFKDTGTYTSNKPCSKIMDWFAVVSTSIQGAVYITLPLSLYMLYKKARPFYVKFMRLIGYLTKISLGLAIIGIVVLPISSIVVGGISLDKCAALSPKLPVYMIGSGISLFLVLATVAMAFVCCRQAEDDDVSGGCMCAACLAGVLVLIQFIFQCVGYASVFPYQLGIDVSGDPATGNNYCDTAVYKISFLSLIFSTFLYFYLPPFLFVSIKNYGIINIIEKRFACTCCAEDDE